MNVAAISPQCPVIAPIKPAINHRVRDVALRALAEGALALTLNFAMITFFAMPVSVALLNSWLMVHLVIWGYKSFSKTISKREYLEKSKELQTASRMSWGSAASNAGCGIALHEAGHATAAWVLLKGSHPKIFIRPFRGGMTTFQMDGRLTKVGKLFGLSGSLAIIAAAGMAASVITSMGQLAFYEKIRDSYPVIKDIVLGHALTQLVTEVFYGISTFALKVKSPGHDFQALWLCGGIHPLVPISLIIALPTIEFLALRYLLPHIKKVTTASGAPSVPGLLSPV